MQIFIFQAVASRSGTYNFDSAPGSGIKVELGRAYPNYGRQGDATASSSPCVPDVNNERSSSIGNAEESAVHKRESNILFVDKLPTDCTRREVGRILLPSLHLHV